MPTYLVTGGAGFIGSHLCDALVAARRHRAGAGRPVHRIARQPAAGATLIEGDVADPHAMRAAIEGVDGCFHLAAIASVTTRRHRLARHPSRQPDRHRSPCSMPSAGRRHTDPGGLCLVRRGVWRRRHRPDREKTPNVRPLSAYGADKYGCELHARVASHVHGIPTTGLRFFNVYGPRQDPRSPYSGVISIFCERVVRGAPIDVFGDGRQTRDFVYVADVVAALLAAMERALPGAPVFNVCTGSPTSVLELAHTIATLAGTVPEVRHLAPRAGEIRYSTGAPERARSAFGLAEPVPLRIGLRKVLDWLASDH